MGKIKFTIEDMQIMSLFNKITHAACKDFIADENQMTFIVPKSSMAKAIGKQGANVKKLELKFKKKIKVVEFNDEVISFIRNLIMPLRIQEASEENNIITLTAKDSKTRGMLIGRAASNLRSLEIIVKRYFPITEIKVQ